MRYLSAHAQHIGGRRYEQDAFELSEYDAPFVEHGGVLAVVCDGMGGMHHGDLASQAAISTIVSEYGKKTPEESIPDALLRSAREANARVLAAANRMGVEGSMGTTLIAVAVRNQEFYYISVGDSALYYVQDRKIKRVNQAHVFGNMLDRAVETGTLSEEDAAAHPERESLTSFIGIANLQEIDRNTDPLTLGPGDTLLLATDGLFKTLSDEEIEKFLNGHPKSWASQLIVGVLDKRHRGQDNVTVLTFTDDSVEYGTLESQQNQSALTVEITSTQLEEHIRKRDAARALANAPTVELSGVTAKLASEPVAKAEEPSPEPKSGLRLSGFLLLGGLIALIALVLAAAFAGYNMGRTSGS